MQNFLNSVVGSYLKVFLSIALALILAQLQQGVLFSNIDWNLIFNAGLVSFLPVLINALNPKDERYGIKQE